MHSVFSTGWKYIWKKRFTKKWGEKETIKDVDETVEDEDETVEDETVQDNSK